MRIQGFAAGLLWFASAMAAAQQAEKPGLFDRIKQKVGENVTVNGKPLTESSSREGGPMRSTMNHAQASLWRQPVYTPESLDGAMHIREGIAGLDQFGQQVAGFRTCDLYLVFASRLEGAEVPDFKLDQCAADEYELDRKRGAVQSFNISKPDGRAQMLAVYRPKIDARIERLRSQDTFWYRPNVMEYGGGPGFSPTTSTYTLQYNPPDFGDSLAVGSGFSGEGFTLSNYPRDETQKRVQHVRPDMAKWILAIPVRPEDRDWFERGGASGPDQRIYFRVKRAYVEPMGTSRRVNLMEVDLYKVHLDMRSGLRNDAPSKVFIIE